jgi:hypothetical protein
MKSDELFSMTFAQSLCYARATDLSLSQAASGRFAAAILGPPKTGMAGIHLSSLRLQAVRCGRAVEI